MVKNKCAKRFSVILPVLNDLKFGYLERNLSEHSDNRDLEIICIDGGSIDGTDSIADRVEVKFISLPNSNRAQRINRGIQESKGKWVIVVHPRSYLSRECLEDLASNTLTASWGAWTHSFDLRHPILIFTSWYSNHIRGDLRSIFYLDHCLFIHRALLDQLKDPLVPEIPIFEDTQFCARLRNLQKGRRLKTKTETSAVRFEKNGILKQCLINLTCKLRYLSKGDLSKVNQLYETNLRLNEEKKQRNCLTKC